MAKNFRSYASKVLIISLFTLPLYLQGEPRSEWDEEKHTSLQIDPIKTKKNVTAKLSSNQGKKNLAKSEKTPTHLHIHEIDDPILSSNIAETFENVNENNSLDLNEEDSSLKNPKDKTILVNFNNVNIVEFIRYLSKISNKNFYFDEEELDFKITIISEDFTSIENVLMALLQEIRIHDFEMIEQGDNIIIHRNPGIKAPGAIKADSLPETLLNDADILTQVFRLNTANSVSVATMIQPILSQNSIVKVLEDTNHIIVTDINANVKKIAELIKSIDAPNSSLIIGQYVVRNAFIDTLIQNAELIMQSVAPGQSITFVSHLPSNSIFVISTPFLVERSIPILQRLDQTDGITGIYNLDDLKYIPTELINAGDVIGPNGLLTPSGEREQFEIGPDGKMHLISPGYNGQNQFGRWLLDKNGNWYYEPFDSQKLESGAVPDGSWSQDLQGNWQFRSGSPYGSMDKGVAPSGYWELGADGKWRFLLTPGESIFANKKIRTPSPAFDLPLGHIERTKFLIHKLNYRLGDSIETAMLKIADSLRASDSVNQDLIATLTSVQWLEGPNSMIFTGTPESLLKVKELIEEIDQPLRQVFIEMLILETSVDDSLDYTVNMGSKFREDGGDISGIQGFQSGASTIGSVLGSAGVSGVVPTNLISRIPDPTPFIANQTGYTAGIVGQKICVGGLEFNSLAALVRAVHSKSDTNIVMNPKILTEDNVTAEIFVGLNTQFKTQSISNDQGSIITNNFEFRDVGTTLRVTPLLGPSNIITLQIEEEVSNIATVSAAGDLIDAETGPTTRISRTSTQVHIPDNFFLVISGMMQDQVDRTRTHVPCLGAAPIIGAAFTGKTFHDQKRCLMIFIRPQLVDTEAQIDRLTEHQQNIYRVKRRTKKMWKLDCEEALDWMNLKETDSNNDERRCCEFKY